MEDSCDGPVTLDKEVKFIVFRSSLQQLLRWCHCPSCGSVDFTHTSKNIGTLLLVTVCCGSCYKKSTWQSQPYIGPYPAGNILLSASLLFAGATATTFLRVLTHMNIASISGRTFFRHQSSILQPAVQRVWKKEQMELFAVLMMEDRKLVLGGDGRADSPGHSAKYGTYTALEVPSNVIIDIQQVQSNECGGSYHMELEGLRRSVAAVEEEGLSIGTIITDRHRQIAKWIRTELPEVQHLYDIWHVAKGISRKLESLAKQKECDAIKPWIRSVVNHLYWSAVSTESGHGDLVAEKWMSEDLRLRQEGKLRFKIRYPKFKKGGYTVCKVSSEPTYGYVQRLMEEVLGHCSGEKGQAAVTVAVPPTLSSAFEHPDKESAIQGHTTRFRVHDP
ncbi:hypothetical protein JOQ06_009760 [Pogonophryne albipinna]|uniref:Transposase n=1 Tax=Pogonophryne albipinna TaxID=1090488 RepID=A0AAD6BSV0_9TELE|nr:hypothetical protein JOQ06_009760 [Pogonophryne albipinna]